MSGMRQRARLGLAGLGLAGLGVLGVAGCSSTGTGPGSTLPSAVSMSPSSEATLAEAPQPAGATPSPIAREVCAADAAGEIEDVVGTKAAVTTPTWVNHLYSCGYSYPQGTMVLSVKELSSWAQTYAYFDQLARHRTSTIKGLGQGAFVASDGSVVVRKDWKVLEVNPTALRGQVGSPPDSPRQVALLVAAVILGCWNGD